MSATPAPHLNLSRRERQIMDVLYRLGKATAAEVHAGLPDAPTQTAVRTLLRILEEKGQVKIDTSGALHVYHPTTARDEARSTMMDHVVRTFFGGSRAQAIASLLGDDDDVSASELARMEAMIAEARRRRSR